MKERDGAKREILSTQSPDWKEPQGLSGHRKQMECEEHSSGGLESTTGCVTLGKLPDLSVQLVIKWAVEQ